MTDTNHIEVLQELEAYYTKNPSPEKLSALQAAITALSARASAGEGGVMRRALDLIRQGLYADADDVLEAALTAAPQPQEPPVQGDGWKKMTDEARKLQMRHLDKHEGDIYHAMQWLVTKFGAKDSGPLFVPLTAPTSTTNRIIR